MSQNQEPLISCVCLTENRVPLLKRAIKCFENQTYNRKELVIVHKQNDFATIELLQSLRHLKIKSVSVDPKRKMSLGELRNLSIQNSSGDFFCQWDDDDWYHNKRLETQILTSNKAASALLNLVIYDSKKKQAFLSFNRLWENSILCKKNIVTKNFRYANLNKSEDTEFVQNLLANNQVFAIESPPMYIYIFHGANTWNHKHFKMLCSLSIPLNKNASASVESIVNEQHSNEVASSILSSLDRERDAADSRAAIS